MAGTMIHLVIAVRLADFIEKNGYLIKTSIEEELTRLNSHIVQFKELVNSDGPVGKKLDFMIQEMNRETNTIGSKAGSGEITKAVIDLKVELEDIREQIQNIE